MRINQPRSVSSLSFLVIGLALISCAGESSSGELPVATATSSPGASAGSTEPAPTTPPVTEGGDQDVSASLVEAHVRERGRYDESVRIELEEETAGFSLPGVSLYQATPLVPDVLGRHCAVYGEEAWCSVDALQNIVREFALGSDPGQLGDEEWLALVAYFTYAAPVEGPDDLERIDRYIPDGIRAMISSPTIERPESGGLKITFYQEEVTYDAYPDGPMALKKVDVVVAGDNTIGVQHSDVWVGTANTDY